MKISKDQVFMSREQFNDLLAKYKNICVAEQEEKVKNKGDDTTAVMAGGQQPKSFMEEQYKSELKTKFKYRASSALPPSKNLKEDEKIISDDKSIESKKKLEALERNFFAKQSVKNRIDLQSTLMAKPKSGKPLTEKPPLNDSNRAQAKRQKSSEPFQTSKTQPKPDKIRENPKFNDSEKSNNNNFPPTRQKKGLDKNSPKKNQILNPWITNSNNNNNINNRGSIVSNIREEIEEKADISTDHDITEEEFVFSDDGDEDQN